jgi:serine/threonine-protein kinase
VLPPGLCRIAEKAMQKQREARHASVAELREELEDFLRGGGWFETRSYPEGVSIVTQGDAAEAAYIIVSGSCEVFKRSGAGRVVLRRLGPGDVFGETAVLTGEPRTASVATLEPVVVKIVTRDALDRELGRGSWAGAFVKALADRFTDVDAQLGRLREEKEIG